jgi:hypothetical protein
MKQVKAPQKTIPQKAMQWSRTNLINLLSGLFDADGSVNKNKSEIVFVSTSRLLVREVSLLLSNLGILSRIYSFTTKPTKKVKVFSHGYRLEINSGNSALFGHFIGFRLSRKQDEVGLSTNVQIAVLMLSYLLQLEKEQLQSDLLVLQDFVKMLVMTYVSPKDDKVESPSEASDKVVDSTITTTADSRDKLQADLSDYVDLLKSIEYFNELLDKRTTVLPHDYAVTEARAWQRIQWAMSDTLSRLNDQFKRATTLNA